LYGSWIYNYQCNQCLWPLTLWVWITFMARCTWYDIMWKRLSVNCDGSVVSINKQTNLKVSHKNKLYKWLNFFEPLANKGLCRVRFDKTHRKSTRASSFPGFDTYRIWSWIMMNDKLFYPVKQGIPYACSTLEHDQWYFGLNESLMTIWIAYLLLFNLLLISEQYLFLNGKNGIKGERNQLMIWGFTEFRTNKKVKIWLF
jgi:hypothetical protein